VETTFGTGLAGRGGNWRTFDIRS